jgi:peptidoglycan/LPS O-acetylase OafA/YrhL
LALLGAWVVSTFVRRDAVFKTLTLVIFAAVFAYRWYLLSVEPLEESHARLYAAFFTGAALRVVADKVPVSTAWMLGAVALLIAGVVYPTIFPWIYTLTLPYLVLYAAYGVAGPLRAYNRMGDYSYGTYIYAFPIQQLVVALMPGVTPWGLTLYAMAATLVFAVASWHWVEQPASRWRWRRLSLKPDYAAG